MFYKFEEQHTDISVAQRLWEQEMEITAKDNTIQ
jgi:hypothetical protein